MPEVTCPQCQTRQPVDPDAEGYQCVACAGTWSFVRCTVCGERFHARPGARAWTCPNCGTPHGRNRRGISRTGIPIPLLVGAVLAVGAIVGLAQALGGDDRAEPPPPTSGTPTRASDPLREVCRELNAMQVFRVQALQEAADALADGADALRAVGDEENAAAVDGIIDAIHTYQDVARGGGDTVAATNELLDALDAVSC